MRSLLAILFFFGSSSLLLAQTERFELGQRLKNFERAWDQQTDPAARKRAVKPLNEAVQQFFSFRLGIAGKMLDEARYQLQSPQMPPGEKRWCESLSVQPETRVFDSKQAELAIEVKPFYLLKEITPPKAVLQIQLGDGKPKQFELEMLPQKISLPLQDVPGPASADLMLKAVILIGDKPQAEQEMMLSRIESFEKRFAQMKQIVKGLEKINTLEQATLTRLKDVFQFLADKTTLETNYPVARLLAECESLYGLIDKGTPFYNASQSGQFWIGIPTSSGATMIRLFVPKGLSKEKPVPLVVALHGAGGSENLFFDGYGDGITRKMCEKNGWIMVATQAGFVGGPPVGTVIDALKERYPVDAKNVFLVGHSMGAAHAISIVQQIPEKIRAVGALGGGGAVRKGDPIQKTPFFVGCGKDDFALRGAKQLADSLKKANVEQVEFKEYPDVEHMVIVRVAIPDLFARWEKLVGGEKK